MVARRGFTLVELLVVIAIIGVLIALLLPAVQAAREAARKTECENHLKQIGLALLNYESTYRTLPPAYLADANGKPMHSWRVLILPFLEEQALYQQYDFNEPWDGPHNSQLAGRISDVFHCPSSTDDPAQTSYVAVVGPQTVWPGTNSMKIRQIIDGTSRTISIVEVVSSGIHWMEPRDISFTEAVQGINRVPAPGMPVSQLQLSSGHPGGVMVLFCDAHTSFLADGTAPAVLRGLLTAAGREPTALPED
jgi:prepilin-type N-terminal cleavage/methylation domain-containing protein/prepilin-type processing-associated H-X9-DG protein